MNKHQETIDRLEEIKEQIKELTIEALDQLRGTDGYHRACRYWFAHIMMQLDDDHSWLGGSVCTMQNSIDELKRDEEEEVE